MLIKIYSVLFHQNQGITYRFIKHDYKTKKTMILHHSDGDYHRFLLFISYYIVIY